MMLRSARTRRNKARGPYVTRCFTTLFVAGTASAFSARRVSRCNPNVAAARRATSRIRVYSGTVSRLKKAFKVISTRVPAAINDHRRPSPPTFSLSKDAAVAPPSGPAPNCSASSSRTRRASSSSLKGVVAQLTNNPRAGSPSSSATATRRPRRRRPQDTRSRAGTTQGSRARAEGSRCWASHHRISLTLARTNQLKDGHGHRGSRERHRSRWPHSHAAAGVLICGALVAAANGIRAARATPRRPPHVQRRRLPRPSVAVEDAVRREANEQLYVGAHHRRVIKSEVAMRSIPTICFVRPGRFQPSNRPSDRQ